LKYANDLGVTDLSSLDDYQPSHANIIGSRWVTSPGISLDNHQLGYTSHAFIATGLLAGDIKDLWL
jgi:hypothetical protein